MKKIKTILSLAILVPTLFIAGYGLSLDTSKSFVVPRCDCIVSFFPFVISGVFSPETRACEPDPCVVGPGAGP